MSVHDGPPTARRASGAQLRRLRIAAGLTQIELAARAAISSRTLRSIELGQLTPQRATLVQTARALGLADVAGFVALWHTSDDAMRTDDDLLTTPIGFDRYLSPSARAAKALQHVIYYATHATIGAGGHLDRNHGTSAVRALAAGLDRSVHVVHDVEPYDWDQVTVDSLYNCDLLSEECLPDGVGKYFEFGLGRSLDAHETVLIGYAVDYSRARRPDVAYAPTRIIGVGARNPGTAVTVQVQFHPALRPANLHYQHTLRTDGEPVWRHPLRLSPHGMAQMVLTDAAAGLHSITWDLRT